MASSLRRLRPAALLLALQGVANATAKASSSNWMTQNWRFDWDPPYHKDLPVPIAAQCDVLQVEIVHDGFTGPDPIGPYTLLVFSSNSTQPYTVHLPANVSTTFNYTVPFTPGTQFEICMFDSTGATGGCQDVYSVYPTPQSANVSLLCDEAKNLAPTNYTFNATLESSDASGNRTPLSRFGWIEQCSDLVVTPQNGRPPYQLTIAPGNHPPLNITSNTMDPIHWPVELTWAEPFFIGLVDVDGNTWSQGVLHAGGPGTTNCFGGGSGGISRGPAIGAGIGGAAAGAVLAALILFVLGRHRRQQEAPAKDDETVDDDAKLAINPSRNVPGGPINPFVLPTTSYEPRDSKSAIRLRTEPSRDLSFASAGPSSPQRESVAGDGMPAVASSAALPNPDNAPSGSRSPPAIYVRHHDGGRALSVYGDAVDIVELPPQYAGSNAHGASADPGPSSSRNVK